MPPRGGLSHRSFSEGGARDDGGGFHTAASITFSYQFVYG